MNKPIRTVSVFCLVLFLALLINATYVQYWRAGELNDHPNNRRVINAAFSRERGAILAGKDAVARSVASDDQYKFQRVYPQPFKYAHVTGFFSYFSQTGVEKSQNQLLSGDDSRLFVTRLIDMLSNSEPQGGNVQLTINPAAQTAAFDGLRALGEDVQGAVVALEPSTGRILAMVSNPTFDPNGFASHDFTAVGDLSTQLNNDESQPLLNRAIGTRLPPGSTFKLVTAAAAIESQGLDRDSKVRAGSSFQLPQSTTSIRNHDGSDCGGEKITLSRALEVSCNTAFLALADEMGTETMANMAEKFGFNDTSLTDLGGQAESAYPRDMDPPQTAMSGIGQSNVAATPLQMAMVVAGIANQGDVMTPYVVDEVRAPNRDMLDQTEPKLLSTAISPATANELTAMMVSTVDIGTGGPAAIPGIDVAGKTGTAQSTPERPPYAWFVGFAPADDPQVAVAVMVESSETAREEIAGGLLGGPIAKAVMEAVINQ